MPTEVLASSAHVMFFEWVFSCTGTNEDQDTRKGFVQLQYADMNLTFFLTVTRFTAP